MYIQAFIKFLEDDILFFFFDCCSGLALNGGGFCLRCLIVITGILLSIAQRSDELDGTGMIITIFQTAKFIGSSFLIGVGWIGGQVRILILQIRYARRNGIINIGRLFTSTVVQCHIAACILIDAKNNLTLVISTVFPIVFYD